MDCRRKSLDPSVIKKLGGLTCGNASFEVDLNDCDDSNRRYSSTSCLKDERRFSLLDLPNDGNSGLRRDSTLGDIFGRGSIYSTFLKVKGEEMVYYCCMSISMNMYHVFKHLPLSLLSSKGHWVDSN